MKHFCFVDFARKMGAEARRITCRKNACDVVGKNPLGQKSLRADVEIEEAVIAGLKKLKVPCAVLGEEKGLTKLSKKPELVFVLDPLDGSENRRRNAPFYCFGLAVAPYGGSMKDVTEAFVYSLYTGEEFYCQRGKGVYWNHVRVDASTQKKKTGAVVAFDFHGKTDKISDKAKLELINFLDHRRMGPDLLDMCYTAAGCWDAFADLRGTLSVVHASGAAMLYENCVVTDASGKALDAPLGIKEKFSVIAAGTKELHKELLKAVRKR